MAVVQAHLLQFENRRSVVVTSRKLLINVFVLTDPSTSSFATVWKSLVSSGHIVKTIGKRLLYEQNVSLCCRHSPENVELLSTLGLLYMQVPELRVCVL